MKSLLIVAHGSRKESSNDEVRELTNRIRSESEDQFAYVDCAFLELAEPSIPDGIRRCASKKNISEIVILPYFLSAGRHVVEDIPGEIDSVRSEFPDTSIKVAPYLGSTTSIAGIMLDIAKQT